MKKDLGKKILQYLRHIPGIRYQLFGLSLCIIMQCLYSHYEAAILRMRYRPMLPVFLLGLALCIYGFLKKDPPDDGEDAKE